MTRGMTEPGCGARGEGLQGWLQRGAKGTEGWGWMDLTKHRLFELAWAVWFSALCGEGRRLMLLKAMLSPAGVASRTQWAPGGIAQEMCPLGISAHHPTLPACEEEARMGSRFWEVKLLMWSLRTQIFPARCGSTWGDSIDSSGAPTPHPCTWACFL